VNKLASSQIHLEILTQDQVRQIHLTALRLLEEVGLWLPNREILELFDDAGAQVDFTAQTVRLPAHLVEACLQKILPPVAVS
jgi:trimethylamine--corrinoid protein Co-methyltransferase